MRICRHLVLEDKRTNYLRAASARCFFPLSLSNSHTATVERERRKGDLVAPGGGGGLFHLRWPMCRWEGAETAGLLPVGGGCRVLGPSTSRFRFPGVDDEAVAAAMLRRNKSSRALPRLGGASLRRYRRARGGSAPAVELMYRRSSPSARRPVRQVSTAALQSFVAMEFRLIWGRR